MFANLLHTIQTISINLLQLLHVAAVNPQLIQHLLGLLPHARPVDQTGQGYTSLQANVVIDLYLVVEGNIHQGRGSDPRTEAKFASCKSGDTFFKLEPDSLPVLGYDVGLSIPGAGNHLLHPVSSYIQLGEAH